MGIEDYTLSGGINSRVEEILSTGLDATPEAIPGLIEELKNRDYRSDMEYLLGLLKIEQLEQRLNSQGTSGVIMEYQEDLRNAISVLQSRVDELDAEEQGDLSEIQGDLSEIQSDLNTLQTTVNSLSTTVQGKANSSDVTDALALKADKTEIEHPEWGEIGGNLTAQTDLVSALSAKASLSDLAAIDTKTRNLENTMSTKADKSELDAKANVDVYAELDTKASTSWAISMFDAADAKIDTKASTSWATSTFATKADKDELDAKINGKASATMWSNVEIPVSGWSASAPYTQTVTVSGMLATYNSLVDIKFTDITDNTAMADEKSYYNCVDHIAMGDNSITLICLDEKPAGTFHIKLKEVS